MITIPDRIGPYEVVGKLGRGGMGLVLRVRREDLQRDFALKLITDATPAAVKRFTREAQAAAALAGHPGIVAVHDVGDSEAGPWLVMDYVEGTSLDRIVSEGELSPQDAARYVAEAARAVHYAHTNGVLHRDLKPANLLLDRSGAVRVADFGLARMHDADAALTKLTQSGELVGTPSYMAPEQARSQPCDPRADVYALGATLYDMLAGSPPFDGPSVHGVVMKLLRDPPPPLRRSHSAVPVDLETIVLCCLAKAPADRYTTAQALADDLERFLRGDHIVARRPSTAERAGRWFRRHAIALTSAAVVSAAAVIGALAVDWGQAATTRANQETTVVKQAADLEELATRASTAYFTLVRETAADMQLLEDYSQHSVISKSDRDAALARVHTAVLEAEAQWPELGLPEAWYGLAMTRSGRAPAGQARLLAAIERAPDDPFPLALLALAQLTGYARDVRPPTAVYSGALHQSAFRESTRMVEQREKAGRAAAQAATLKLWPMLRSGTEFRAFVTAVEALAGDRPEAVSAVVLPLRDDPILGGMSLMLHAIACSIAMDQAGAAEAFAALGSRGWVRAKIYSAVATSGHAIGLPPAERGPWLTKARIALQELLDAHGPDGIAVGLGIVHLQEAQLPGVTPAQRKERILRAIDAWIKGGAGTGDYADVDQNAATAYRWLAEDEHTAGRDPLPYLQLSLKLYDLAVAGLPTSIPPLHGRCKAYLLGAKIANGQGRPVAVWLDRAEADASASLAIDNDRTEARYQRGSIAYLQSDLLRSGGQDATANDTRGLADYAQLSRTDPTNFSAWAGKAEFELRLGKFDDAAASAREGLKRAPGNGFLQRILRQALARRG